MKTSQHPPLEQVPTVYPTQQEFDDPITYLSSASIRKLGEKYGMIKLKPPSSWKPPFAIDETVFKFKPRMQKLSELSLFNRIRTLFKDGLGNFMKMSKKRIPNTSYVRLGNREKLYFYDLYLAINQYILKHMDSLEQETKAHDSNGRNTVFNQVRQRSDLWKALNTRYNLEARSIEIEQFYNEFMKDYCILLAKKYNSKLSLMTESEYQFNHNPYNEEESEDEEYESDEEEEEEDWCQICEIDSDDVSTLLCDGCNKGYHLYCLSPPLTKIPRGSWFCDSCLVGTGDYGFVTSDTAYSLQEFKKLNDEFKERYFTTQFLDSEGKYLQELSKTCLTNEEDEEQYVNYLEKEFWDNLVNNEQSRLKVNYGADIHNMKPGQISGFPMNYPFKEGLEDDYYINHSFNLTKLPFANGSLLNHLNDRISGMTIPWLYIGSLFSTFCWHLEDHYMLSANYCHYGDIKKWYCIPESDCHRFEVLMKELAPDLFLRQPDLLHQLVTLLSPYEIRKNGVRCYYANQKPGEYIITFPKCYHAGFNCGFNVNEAVNFTNNDWLRFSVNALNDYKLVKKPPVFDQSQLCYGIMYHLLNELSSQSQFTWNNKITTQNYEMVILCIAYMEKNLDEQNKQLQKFRQSFDGSAQQRNIQFTNDIKVAPTGFDVSRYKNLDKFYQESSGGNDIICCNCKEICGMAWVEIFDKKYHSRRAKANKSIEQITPEPLPDNRKRVAEYDSKDLKRTRMGATPVGFTKENVSSYCLVDFNKAYASSGLTENKDFVIWIRFGQDNLNQIIHDVKYKLSTLQLI